MTTRTFRLLGQAYGAGPVSIVAKIDGAVVYSGPVPTTTENPPPMGDPNLHLGVPLFSWTALKEFQGTFALEVSETSPEVDTTFLYITGTDANYVWVPDPANPGNLIPGGANAYSGNFYETQNDSQGEWISGQSIIDADIDGVEIDITNTRDLPSQYFIRLLPDQVLTATIRTDPGVPAGNVAGQ